MASFEDLSFDWSTLCQECPECWTTSAPLTILLFICFGQTLILPKPPYNNMYGPVCASDFTTYSTRLSFSEAQKRKNLVIIHAGKCKRTCTLYHPVCGSDSNNYHNLCHFNYAQTKDLSLFVKHVGRCKDEGDERGKLFGINYFDENKHDESDYNYEWDPAILDKKKCVLT